MKLILLIFKKLITYTVAILIVYLIIVNVTISISTIIDGIFKSICLAILLVPISLVNYFSSYIAKNAQYSSKIAFDIPYEAAFKSARTLLKTMIELKLIDSNIDNGSLNLESTFSKLDVKLTSLNDDKTEFLLISTPKIYDNINDYDKYTKDLLNVLNTLKLNLAPEKYERGNLEELVTQNSYDQEFKPCLLLYYRLIKVWFIVAITVILFFVLYNLFINLVPNVTTIAFFSILFVYMFYVLSNEITNITELIKCPACKKKLLTNKYNMLKYSIPNKCNNCQIELLSQNNIEK